MNAIGPMADVLELEAEQKPFHSCSTYEMIGAVANPHCDAPVLSFFMRIEGQARPEVWTCERLFKGITATANLLHEREIGTDNEVAFVLPNVPEAHLAIWGGQAAGISFVITQETFE